MALNDKVLGGLMLFAASFVFLYYSVWALLLPLLDSSNPLHAFFPTREWAVRLPAIILIVGLMAIGTFIGCTIIKENRKIAQKQRARIA